MFISSTLLILPTLSVKYFDQLLGAARQVHVVYLAQLLGAVLFIHFISNHDNMNDLLNSIKLILSYDFTTQAMVFQNLFEPESP